MIGSKSKLNDSINNSIDNKSIVKSSKSRKRKVGWIARQTNVLKKISESQKGALSDLKITSLTNRYGEPHPEDYEENEILATRAPIVRGAIDKTVDFVVGNGFYVVSDDDTAKRIVEDFIREVDFDIFLRRVTEHLLTYGNCFVEIVGEGSRIDDLIIWDPKSFYVNRNKKTGKIEGYTQKISNTKLNSFNPEDIAHFKINVIANNAYGTSLINPVRTVLKRKLQFEKDISTLLSRKLNAPIHFKVGSDMFPASQSDIDSFSTDWQSIKADEELITNHTVEADVIGFRNQIIDISPFNQLFEYNVIYGLQVPLLLLGITEGANKSTADAQTSAFIMRRKSVQLYIEKVLESSIFSRLLQDSMSHVEFEWGMTDEERLNETKNLLSFFNSKLLVPQELLDAVSKRIAVINKFDIPSFTPVVRDSQSKDKEDENEDESPKKDDEDVGDEEEFKEKLKWFVNGGNKNDSREESN